MSSMRAGEWREGSTRLAGCSGEPSMVFVAMEEEEKRRWAAEACSRGGGMGRREAWGRVLIKLREGEDERTVTDGSGEGRDLRSRLE